MSEYRPLRVALLGAGSVGAEVARLLLEQKQELKSRVGAELELVGVAVRDLTTKREGFPKELLTTDVESLILGADIVIKDCYLPADIGPEDLLAVAATGAYCHSLASNYNYLPRPAMVAVLEGKVKVLMNAETESAMLSRDPGYQTL